nr:MAG TPA: hypothetical protein [Caudoviricetes sp.]
MQASNKRQLPARADICKRSSESIYFSLSSVPDVLTK